MIVDLYSKQGWSEEQRNKAASTSYTEMLTSRTWNNERAICLYKFLALQKNTFAQLLEPTQVSD
jgi:hypothetical protein